MQSKKVLVVGINGSPRKTGGTVNMLREALSEAAKFGAETRLIHLLDYKMKPYKGDYSKKPDPKALKVLNEIEGADAIILATPTHWLGPSTLMKMLIDNMTYFETGKGYRLQGKVAGVLAHCWEDGGFGVARDLAAILNTMGCILPPYAINMRNRYLSRNEQTDWMWTDAKLLGKSVVVMAEIIIQMKPDWSYKNRKFA